MSCLVKFGTPLALACASVATAQPAPPPGDLQRSAFITQMDAQFRLRDADGDGRITRAELTQFEQRTAHSAALAENARAFARLDANHDGALSAAEFAALVPPAAAPDVTPLMQRFDPNRDQAITLIEYRAATLANFDALDADHDGVVTQAEMRAGNVPTGAGR
jgi:Ca2+-binding EF-hand superfamily protein